MRRKNRGMAKANSAKPKTLGKGEKLKLGGSQLIAFALLIAMGTLNAPASHAQADAREAFEVASVRQFKNYTNADFRFPTFLPGGRFMSTAPLDMVIAAAWHLPYHSGERLSGGPSWMRSDDGVYDIDARSGKGVISDTLDSNARAEAMRPMLQKLLLDRFQLVIHRETREMPIYALVVAKGGPRLEKADIEETGCKASMSLNLRPGDPIAECHLLLGGRGRGLRARAVNMSDLAHFVEGFTDRPLIDETGVEGLYRIETKGWLPLEPGPPPTPGARSEDGTALADLPTLFQVFESLGLKMVAQKGNAQVYVVDHLERPTEN
jgi:uncharacterized protein (TIGR03435 family)